MTTTIAPSVGAGIAFTQQGTGASPGYAAIDLRRAESPGLQEGVVEAAAYMVVQRSAGANLSVDIGANGGFALVQGDTVTGQGLYTVPPHTAVINEAITAAHATNPRIDQVILEIQDNVHDASGGNLARVRVLAGTATGGATLDNRTGAAALPSNALLLADVLVPATDTTIANSQIRDRRKWARGAMARTGLATSPSTASGSIVAVDAGLLKRYEFSGVPVKATWYADVRNNTGSTFGTIQLFMDGALITGAQSRGKCVGGAEAVFDNPAIQFTFVPAAGSHTLEPRWGVVNAGTMSATANSAMVVEEIMRQDSVNNSTTSG